MISTYIAGCKVMLLYNMDQKKGLVNGSQGVLTAWVDWDNNHKNETEEQNPSVPLSSFRD